MGHGSPGNGYCFPQCLFSIVILDKNEVIDIDRNIGDGGLYFYIQDIIIQPDYQNKGIGKSVMKEIMLYLNRDAQKGAFIGLMAARGLEKYYNSFGF